VGIPDLSNGKNIIRANLVKPAVWDEALKIATGKLPCKGPGILIFGSALNLLLFSPTYGGAIFKKMKKAVASDKSFTYIFSVSTAVKVKEISELENAADNLILTRAEKEPFRLFMTIIRIKDVQFDSSEIAVS